MVCETGVVTADELLNFLENEMQMQHVYQPLMIRCLLDANGSATVRELATAFAVDAPEAVGYYERRIRLNPVPVLERHGVIEQREGRVVLKLDLPSVEERAQIRWLCDTKIAEYLERQGVETVDELRSSADSITNNASGDGDVEWALIPGDISTKPDLATTYGGNRQAGISVSGTTPNILCYTNAQKNEQHGYNFDGWVEGDSVFHYTGHGDEGDQVFRVGRRGIGNAALRDHVINGKTVRMFVADGTMPGTNTGRQLYIGEFRLDESNPYFRAESLDVLDELRSVIVFRLLAIGNVLVRPEDRCPNEIQPSGSEPILEVPPEPETDTATSVEDVEFSDTETTSFERRPMQSVTGQLREKQLVLRYREFLTAQGHQYTLQRYRIPGSSAYNEIDLLDTTRNELVEAKSSSTRGHVRYAIGQLMDYQRRIQAATTAVLLPSCPSDDLLELIHQAGVICIFEEAAGVFTRIEPPN